MNQTLYPKRLEIYMADLPDDGGSIQYGYRPVIIVQNDVGNMNSPTTIVVPLTSKPKKKMPTHVTLPPEITSLPRKSVALCEQIRTIQKCRLKYKMGAVRSLEYESELIKALEVSLSL